MPQSSYTIDTAPVGYPGQLVDIGISDVVSGLAGEAIPYGRAVKRDSGDYSKSVLALPTADTDEILGIAVADQHREQDPSVALPSFKQTEAIGVLRQGRVYVVVGAGATAVPGEPVFVRHAGGELGELTSINDGDTVALPGATWQSNAAAGEFAVVEIK